MRIEFYFVYIVLSKQTVDSNLSSPSINGKKKREDSLQLVNNQTDITMEMTNIYSGEKSSKTIKNEILKNTPTFETIQEENEVISNVKPSLYHIDDCNDHHNCFKLEKDEEIMRFEDKINFKCKVPIDLFKEYDASKKYFLKIIFLPTYNVKRLIVATKKSGSSSSINFYVKSSWFFEYMLDSNVVLYFETEKDGLYVKESKLFSYLLTKPPNKKSKMLSWIIPTEENTIYFDKNTFEENRKPYTKPPALLWDVAALSYILKHMYRGKFMLNKNYRNVLVLYIHYIPFLICPSNMNYFVIYRKTFNFKIKDLHPESIKLHYQFYEYLLDNDESNFQEKIIDIIFYLYDILNDIINHHTYTFYKNSECFKKKFFLIERELIIISKDKNILSAFKRHLNCFSKFKSFKYEAFADCYKCLIFIFECLFLP